MCNLVSRGPEKVFHWSFTCSKIHGIGYLMLFWTTYLDITFAEIVALVDKIFKKMYVLCSKKEGKREEKKICARDKRQKCEYHSMFLSSAEKFTVSLYRIHSNWNEWMKCWTIGQTTSTTITKFARFFTLISHTHNANCL